MNTPRPGQTSTQAFTLIELLVVIAIIAILAALAIPAIGGAIKRSNASKGLSNMKQIGVAMNIYAGENNGMLPLMMTFWPQKPHGLEGIEPYLDTVNGKGAGKQLYVCPNRTIKVPTSTMDSDGWFNYRTFSCNPNVLRWSTKPGDEKAADRKRIVSIPRPTETILIIDGAQAASGKIANTGLDGLPAIDPSRQEMKDASFADTSIPTDGDSDPQSKGFIRYRQPGETAHALFVDGHVQAAKKGSLQYRNFSTAY